MDQLYNQIMSQYGLIKREREVTALLMQGKSNAEIADAVHLTPATIKGYVSIILTKLDCKNRTQLADKIKEAVLIKLLLAASKASE